MKNWIKIQHVQKLHKFKIKETARLKEKQHFTIWMLLSQLVTESTLKMLHNLEYGSQVF